MPRLNNSLPPKVGLDLLPFRLPGFGAVLFLAFVLIALTQPARAQVSVGYTMQTVNFNSLLTEKNNNPPYAGTYNNGSTELANYANGGSFNNTPGAAAFETFTTTGNGNTGSVRGLQVGDTFTITAFTGANPSAGGYLGISFRDSTTYANFFSSTDNTTEARFQLDNTGGWKVYNGGTAVDSGLGSNADRTFTIKITSDNTFNATIGANTYYDLTMAAGGGKIDSFAIYTFGDNNQNSFWKSATLTSTGTVELGYAAPNGTTRTFSAVISDGLAANSTSTASPNAVFIGGDAGSQVNLAAANTYTGATTVNANASLELQNAAALGSTNGATVVNSGASLKLYGGGSGISYNPEAVTLNGLGPAYGDVGGDAGALRSVGGGNNTWNGAITLGSNSRINSDAAGGAGSLTIAGNIAGGNNVLYIGTKSSATANMAISGAISGAGATQDGTTTSLFKDGAATLTLSGNNTFSGDTRISAGNITVATGGTLGNGTSDVFIANGASLAVNANATIASLQEWGTTNSGTASIGSGATLTVSGNDYSTYMNSIGGAGNLVKSGTGTMNLFGTQSYSGATTVSGGRLSTGVALGSSGVTVSGGTFETTAANILADTATVTVNSGTYSVGGNDTIGALSGTGGTINLGANRLTTTVASGSSSYTGGTISGTGGGITKAGSGTFVLGGNNTYTGATTVEAGELRLMGVLSSSSLLSVNAGATLSGTGTIGGATTISGVHSPGTSPGIQTFSSDLTYNAGSTLSWELTANTSSSGARGTSYDGVNLGSGANLTFAGATKMSLVFNSAGSSVSWSDTFWSSDKSWLVYDLSGAGAITGTNNFSVDAINWVDSQGNLFTQSRPEASFSISVSGQDLNLIYTIPEPSTYALLALSGIALGFYAYRRRRRPML